MSREMDLARLAVVEGEMRKISGGRYAPREYAQQRGMLVQLGGSTDVDVRSQAQALLDQLNREHPTEDSYRRWHEAAYAHILNRKR